MTGRAPLPARILIPVANPAVSADVVIQMSIPKRLISGVQSSSAR